MLIKGYFGPKNNNIINIKKFNEKHKNGLKCSTIPSLRGEKSVYFKNREENRVIRLSLKGRECNLFFFLYI